MNFFRSNMKISGGIKMEENQEINCTVTSCKYNNGEEERCMLQSIQVEPILDCDTMEADESMCASYEYSENDEEE